MLTFTRDTSFDDDETVRLERVVVPARASITMVRLEPWVLSLLPRSRRLVPRGL